MSASFFIICVAIAFAFVDFCSAENKTNEALSPEALKQTTALLIGSGCGSNRTDEAQRTFLKCFMEKDPVCYQQVVESVQRKGDCNQFNNYTPEKGFEAMVQVCKLIKEMDPNSDLLIQCFYTHATVMINVAAVQECGIIANNGK